MASTSHSGGGSAGNGGGGSAGNGGGGSAGNGGGGGGNTGGDDNVGDNSPAEKLAYLSDLQNCYNEVLALLALYEPLLLLPDAEHDEVTQTPSLQAVCGLLCYMKYYIEFLMEEEENESDSS